MSKDLFRRAIMESGSCVAGSPWGAWNATATQNQSNYMALSVNATDLESLRHVPTATMLASPYFSLGPSADGWHMKQNPSELPVLAKGVDIIVGANTMDTLNAPPYMGLDPRLPDFTPKTAAEFKTLATDYFGAGVFDVFPEPPATASKDDVARAFYRLQGDVCNQCPKHFAAQKFLAANETVYVYEFAFARAPFRSLACHGCELGDVFNQGLLTKGLSGPIAKIMNASYDARLGDIMSRYWANFVKNGLKNHQPHGTAPAWPEYRGSVQDAKSLDFTISSVGEPQIGVRQGLDYQRCDFFSEFIKASTGHWRLYENFCFAPVPLSSAPTIVV